jgi:hypothetical protein
MTLHFVVPPSQCRSCWWRPQFQTSPTGCTWDDWARMPLSCVCRRNSRECDSRLHSHTKMATRGASRNGRTVGAGMCMLKTSMVMTRLHFIHTLFTKNYDHVLGTSRSFHIQLKMCYTYLLTPWSRVLLNTLGTGYLNCLYAYKRKSASPVLNVLRS